MKKLITMSSGLSLASASIFSTIACSNGETKYTIEYNSTAGLDSEEVNDIFSINNTPVIFIAFGTSDNQGKFLIIKDDKTNSNSVNKVKNFYGTLGVNQNYGEKKIKDIKYSYLSKIFIINNQHINADFVTNIDYIK